MIKSIKAYMRTRPLKCQVRFMGSAVAVFFTLSMFAINYMFFKNEIEEKTKSHLYAISEQQHMFIQSWFNEKSRAIKHIASLDMIQSVNETDMADYFRGFLQENDEFFTITFIDKTGISRVDPILDTGVNVSDREYFKEALKGHSFITDVLIGKQTKYPIVIFSSPVYNKNNEFTGVIVAPVKITTLDDIMSKFQSEGLNSYILSSQGTYVTAPSELAYLGINELIQKSQRSEIYIHALKERSVSSPYSSSLHSKEVYGSYHWTNNGKWLIINELDQSYALKNLHQHLILYLFFILTGIVAFTWVNVRVTGRINRPIQQILASSKKVQAGKYEEINREIATSIEFVELIETLNHQFKTTQRSISEINEREQRYRSLFEQNPDIVYSFDRNGHFIEINDRVEPILGYKREEVIGTSFIPMIHEPYLDQVLAAFGDCLNGDSVYLEVELKTKANGIISTYVTGTPIIIKGEVVGVHGISKDITEQKSMLNELKQSEKKYHSLYTKLNEFAKSMYQVMKISDLVDKLLTEVQSSIKPLASHIVQLHTKTGETKFTPPTLNKELAPTLYQLNQAKMVIGQIYTNHDDWSYVKLGGKEDEPFILALQHSELNHSEKVWLSTFAHYVNILFENLQSIESLLVKLEEHEKSDASPVWLLRLLFSWSEKERSRLSLDLHDEALQNLIVWYRKLEALLPSLQHSPLLGEVEQIKEGMLDVIHQIRTTCNELRPPMLKEMGIIEAIHQLIAQSNLHHNFTSYFEHQFSGELTEEQSIGIYRIIQELITNTNKHSHATSASLKIWEDNHMLFLKYSDNGIGTDLDLYGESFATMGISGIRKRVSSLQGSTQLISSNGKGFQAEIVLPLAS